MGLQHGFLLAICLLVCSVTVQADVSEEKLLSLINEADQKPTINLFGGLSLRKIEGQRSFIVDKSDLLQSAENFFETHELHFDYPSEEQLISESRSSRLKKVALPLLLALKLKFSVLIPLLLKALAFISIKALIAGKLALLLASMTFLKDLFGKKQEKVTTAYISATGPLGIEMENWNRNGDIAATNDIAYNQAYNAYNPVYAPF